MGFSPTRLKLDTLEGAERNGGRFTVYRQGPNMVNEAVDLEVSVTNLHTLRCVQVGFIGVSGKSAHVEIFSLIIYLYIVSSYLHIYTQHIYTYTYIYTFMYLLCMYSQLHTALQISIDITPSL